MNTILSSLRTVHVTRYVKPLREGGSLPAIVEADDGFLYVLKFRGAGQGVKALVAELVAGQLAHLLGLKMPEIVFAHLDPILSRTEADEEIQDLLKASGGLNLAVHYLSGAITFDPLVTKVDAQLASKIVWLDCFITNVDRTARNTNMLIWHKELWLIDHGASLYFHHNWQNWEEHPLRSFSEIKNHVLLPWASELTSIDSAFRKILTDESIHSIVSSIPDEWLMKASPLDSVEEQKKVYAQFLRTRLAHSENFIKEANDARETLI
jgi:hypothetical protein